MTTYKAREDSASAIFLRDEDGTQIYQGTQDAIQEENSPAGTVPTVPADPAYYANGDLAYTARK